MHFGYLCQLTYKCSWSMRTYLLNLLLILLVLSCEKTPEARQAAFRTPFEAGGGNRTATYPELLTF